MEKLLFIGATHGDEQFGVRALERVADQFEPAVYGYDWIVGNPRALEAGTRFCDADLNRSAPGDPNDDRYELRRAAEIMELSEAYDIEIDIHGTKTDCGMTSIIPFPTRENIALARSLPIARNVIWYAQQADGRGPLTQFVRARGLELEFGPKDAPETQLQLEQVLGQILMANAAGTLGETVNADQEFYEVYGKLNGETDARLQDFQPVATESETFYPYLSQNSYPGISCIKLRVVAPEVAARGLEVFHENFVWT